MSLLVNSVFNDYLPSELKHTFSVLSQEEELEIHKLIDGLPGSGEVREVEIAILLDQMNRFNVPSGQKVQALKLFIQAGSIKNRAIALTIINELNIPDEHRLEALRFFLSNDLTESERLCDLANKIKIPVNQRLEAMRILSCIRNDWEREPFCRWMEDLCGSMTGDEKIRVMNRYLTASWDRREDLIRKTFYLRDYFGIEDSSNLLLIHAIENSESLDDKYDIHFPGFLEIGDFCVNRLFMNEEEVLAILLNLSKISYHQWRTVKDLLSFWMSTEHKIAILEACGSIPEDLFDYAAEIGRSFITFPFKRSIAEQKTLLIKAALIPELYREAFNDMPKDVQIAMLNNLPRYSEKERLAYLEMNSDEWIRYSQLQGEEKWRFLSDSHEKREVRRLAIENVQGEMEHETCYLLYRYHAQKQTREWSENTALDVNTLELTTHPHRYLLDFLQKKKSIFMFPMICFVGPDQIAAEAIDQGGVIRDFTRMLFDGICQKEKTLLPMIQDMETGKWIPNLWHPNSLHRDEKDLLPPSYFAVLPKETQIVCYKAIGLFFAIAMDHSESLSPIPIGIHFHESVFEMLQAYSPFSSTSSMQKKLFYTFIKSYYADLFDTAHISPADLKKEVEDLLEGKISDRLLKERGIDKELCNNLIAKGKGVTEAILIIAQSLYKHNSDWKKLNGFSLHSPDAKALREKIEGVFSKEEVLRAFDLEDLSMAPCEKVEYMHWLRDWIVESDLETVQLLVIAVSGSQSLVKYQSLSLKIANERDIQGWPHFRTCFFAMYIPRYPDYKTFKSKLDAGLARFAEEMNKGVPFQGIV